MSTRITLSDREVWHIVEALKAVKNETSLGYQVIKAGNQALQDIIDKLQPPTDGFELKPDGTVTNAL